MGYRKTGYIEQIFYVIKHKLLAWCEWIDAKAWVKDYHPGWIVLATKAKHENVRKTYRNMILELYREVHGGG